MSGSTAPWCVGSGWLVAIWILSYRVQNPNNFTLNADKLEGRHRR